MKNLEEKLCGEIKFQFCTYIKGNYKIGAHMWSDTGLVCKRRMGNGHLF